MLTAAGAAATGIAGAASATLVNVTDQIDRWAGEHYWQMTSSGGTVVASAFQLTYYGSFAYFSYVTNTSSDIWGSVFLGIDLAAGDYTVTMQDSYGDGWAWGSFVGGVYVSSSGGMSAGASLPSGSSTSFSFTVAGVIPAPGALALLGLAGLAGSRRRK